KGRMGRILANEMPTERNMLVAMAGLFFQFAPWMAVQRITFIYHFFASVPFVIMCTVYCAKRAVDRYGRAGKAAAFALVAVAAALFVLYYPVISGMEAGRGYLDALKLPDRANALLGGDYFRGWVW
ncbi:MAG: hypothetical protein FWE70_04540, partial [Oscillospiraceae bacterium]|nr:hypothetical protein [Oscillospiraceae bacterium]